MLTRIDYARIKAYKSYSVIFLNNFCVFMRELFFLFLYVHSLRIKNKLVIFFSHIISSTKLIISLTYVAFIWTVVQSAKLFLSDQSAALKEVVDDLEWPGSSIQIKLQPTPPSVIFRGEGHGDLQIDFNYYANIDLLIAFSCDRQVSHRYKYKFLRATTSNIPGSVIRDNRGSKVTIGRGGMLKIQHLVSVAKPSIPHPQVDSAGYQQPSRIAYIEFFVKPEEEEENVNDA